MTQLSFLSHIGVNTGKHRCKHPVCRDTMIIYGDTSGNVYLGNGFINW